MGISNDLKQQLNFFVASIVNKAFIYGKFVTALLSQISWTNQLIIQVGNSCFRSELRQQKQ